MLTTTDRSIEQAAGAAVSTYPAPPLVQGRTGRARRHRADGRVASLGPGAVTVRPRWPVPVELGVSLVDFDRRGFAPGATGTRDWLESRAGAFVAGFNAASRTWPDPHRALAAAVDEPLRGFAYEGAAMSARLASARGPGRSAAMLAALMAGPGDAYVHLIHVGYGWLPGPSPTRAAFRPPPTGLLRWLSFDGAGFSKVFFGGHAAVGRLARRHRSRIARIALPGAGRALWFLDCADPDRIAADIDATPPAARDRLWSGVGLAMAYAGGVEPDVAERVVDRSGRSRRHLAQGVAFAATAAARAGHVAPLTATLAAELFGAGVDSVAADVDRVAADLVHRPDAAAYELWRSRIRELVAR